jgi:hypothetical protein
MHDWKFQAILAENNIDGLDDACLNIRFVEQARQFMKATDNKEAHPGKLHQLDDELVKLFWELHEVDEEEDEEKVTAIKSNQEAKRMIADLQKEMDGMRKTHVQLQAQLQELDKLKAEKSEQERAKKLRADRIEAERIKAEKAEKERVEAERIENERIEALKNATPPPPTTEQLLQKRKDRLMNALAEATATGRSIRQTDLLELGVPAEKFKSFMSFKYEGYEFLRPIFGQAWGITK